MGRHVATELFHMALGLGVALAMTWGAAWAYPLGHDVIWGCGMFAIVVTALMGVGPLNRAAARDRNEA